MNAQAIETEIRRLGGHDTSTNCSGICVYQDEYLPLGWVRVSDGTGEVFGLATEIAAVLAAVPVTGEIREDGSDVDCEATWEALGEFSERAPQNSHDWPEGLIQTERLEDGDCNDNPNTLITVETNSGTRYAAGPHGVDCCALADWFSASEDLAETREQAVEEG